MNSPATDSARAKRIKRAGIIGIFGNGILAVAKIAAGFLSNSTAVTSDGVDSILDVLGSIITVFAAGVLMRPPDIDHPYGHSRAETVATKSVSFLIFFAGAQLAISAIRSLINAETIELPTTVAFFATGFSIVGKLGLMLFKAREARALNSSVLQADAQNMLGDVVVSLAVLGGVSLAVALNRPWIDAVTALCVSIYILWVAFGMFMKTTMELMEGHANASTYQQVFDAVEQVAGAEHPHRTRIRELGGFMIIDLDIEVDGDLPVREAHEIATTTESRIRDSIPNVYDVLVHVEPIGNVEDDESYGVSQRKLNEHFGK